MDSLGPGYEGIKDRDSQNFVQPLSKENHESRFVNFRTFRSHLLRYHAGSRLHKHPVGALKV